MGKGLPFLIGNGDVPDLARVSLDQRRGLGIAKGRLLDVRDIDPRTGRVTVKADRDRLRSDRMIVRSVRW